MVMVRAFVGRMVDSFRGIDSELRKSPDVHSLLHEANELGRKKNMTYPAAVLREFFHRTPLETRIRDAVKTRKPLRGLLHDLAILHPDLVVGVHAAVVAHQFAKDFGMPIHEAASTGQPGLVMPAVAAGRGISASRDSLAEALSEYKRVHG
ncbi:hypothetical protein HY994_00065 [Candidatus Micrarchaeota archaeon]|nr:hypothetical protein [Candidatus Micrarchaeota archaeon]